MGAIISAPSSYRPIRQLGQHHNEHRLRDDLQPLEACCASAALSWAPDCASNANQALPHHSPSSSARSRTSKSSGLQLAAVLAPSCPWARTEAGPAGLGALFGWHDSSGSMMILQNPTSRPISHTCGPLEPRWPQQASTCCRGTNGARRRRSPSRPRCALAGHRRRQLSWRPAGATRPSCLVGRRSTHYASPLAPCFLGGEPNRLRRCKSAQLFRATATLIEAASAAGQAAWPANRQTNERTIGASDEPPPSAGRRE